MNVQHKRRDTSKKLKDIRSFIEAVLLRKESYVSHNTLHTSLVHACIQAYMPAFLCIYVLHIFVHTRAHRSMHTYACTFPRKHARGQDFRNKYLDPNLNNRFFCSRLCCLRLPNHRTAPFMRKSNLRGKFAY